MKLKMIRVKQILIISVWCLIGVGFITLLSFVDARQKTLPCKAIDIKIDDKIQLDFIDENEILNLIDGNQKIIGSPIGSINISLLEKRIMSNPYVEKAEVYSTIDGKLQVNVMQRNPLVRIITMRDEHFYIDCNGNFMPVSNTYSIPVIVANGYIYDTYAEMKIPAWRGTSANVDTTANQPEHILSQVYRLSQFIKADTFWNAQIEQIYVNSMQEIELTPRVGDQHIILGNADNLEEKFHKLYTFYTNGLEKTGWNNYSIINLKFKNQVVCTKKNQ